MTTPNNDFLDALVNGNIEDVAIDGTPNNQKTADSHQTATDIESTQVPADSPAAPETTVQTPSPEASIDYEKISGGAAKSQEEFEQLIQRATKYNELETQLSDYRNKVTDYEAKLNTDPFANDEIRKLNELIASGASQDQIRAFQRINSIDVATIEPKQARILALQMKHNLSAEDAELMVNNQYKLDPDLHTDEEIRLAKIQLQIDSDTDKAYLAQYKAEVSTSPQAKQQADLEKQVTEYAAKAEPVVKKLVSDYTSGIKGVNLNGKRGDEAIVTDLPVSEESVRQAEQVVLESLVAQQVPLNEENIGKAKEFLENYLIVTNWKSMAIDIASKTEERIRQEFHNPAVIDRGIDNPNTSQKSSHQETLDWIVQNS